MSKSPYPELPILIIDDDVQILDCFQSILRINGISNVECCQDSLQVMPLLEKKKFILILLDIKMPGIRGDELLPQIVEEYQGIPVIMVTAVNDIEIAVDCMKNGAFDYLVKPVETSKLLKTIQHTLNFLHSRKEIFSLKEYFFAEALKNPANFKNIITINKKMLNVLKHIEVISETRAPILITGEPGTGKELIALAIHKISSREGDFIRANIAGLDDHLFADTLFGHEKGAFTGAVSVQEGLVEQAANGTLFLDEIGELSIPSQVILLRLLQENEYYRLGSDKPAFTNARFVMSTNKDINAMKEKGTFRKDLYFHLNTHHIHLPPLRERKGDIPLLLDYFVKEASKKFEKEIPPITGELLQLLSNYPFPGNIPELKSMVYDAMSRHQPGSLSLEVFLEKIREQVS